MVERRSRRKPVLWGMAGLLSLVLLAGVVVYHRLNGNLRIFDGDALSRDRPAAGGPDAQGRTPVNVLLIGSDSRDGANRDLGGGVESGARSDTTILLHVYADHRHAVGVSIPRDSLVDIPPCMLPDGKWTRQQTGATFNSAFEVGGSADGNPACSQNTVEKLTGLRVDHTIVVNFSGFASMTSAVGGVEVCVPKPVYEGDLNPNLGRPGRLLFPQGKQRVQGQAALDYVRLRHGIGDGSDIGRTKRQQAFLGSLLRQIKGVGMNPATLLPLADAATGSLVVDPGLGSAVKLLDFALSLRDIELADARFLTVPWRYQGSRVALVQPDATQLWAALRAERPLDGSDADASASPGAAAQRGIEVEVRDGSGTAGLAARATEQLTLNGFTLAARAAVATPARRTTAVRYGPGQESAAREVAGLFPGAGLEPSAEPGVVLLLGRELGTATASPGGASPGGGPAGRLPASLTAAGRSAADDPCTDLSYG
ncbi:LCP family protein [Kitasatospora sp. MBT63]|uniref:LCP family protein n=1 Tax=Kitasatospora sp. MBT63 TaxID=1444768 RepID=UPI000A7B4C8A|nr:LCP family protein [Kitasatospora sp. MBT63]